MLIVLDARRRAIALAAETIAPADGLVRPPGPILIVQKRVMKNDDPAPFFDEVLKVLLARGVKVSREIVHDDHVIFPSQVGLESRGTRDDGKLVKILDVGED